MEQQLHLVRHGEVSNPDHIVYGDLAGFHLSTTGLREAQAAAEHLSGVSVEVVLASPLERAVETAAPIATRHDLEPVIDERLTESGQFPHWTGHRWESIPELFPGELEAYLENAASAGADEALEGVASRVIAAIDDQLAAGNNAIVVVSHQDPVQATRLVLTGRDLADLRADPPGHGEVITLSRTDQSPWRERMRWSPSSVTG